MAGALLLSVLAVTHCNIVSMDDVKLLPYYFDFRNRYVYSDLLDNYKDAQLTPLKDAIVSAELKIVPRGFKTKNDSSSKMLEEQRLFIFMGDREILSVALSDLETKRTIG